MSTNWKSYRRTGTIRAIQLSRYMQSDKTVGRWYADKGDYLIKYADGVLELMLKDIFERKYEEE